MLLEVQNVYKRFGRKQVLHGFSLEIPEGQIVGLLGPNGSGKTTLIKCINDLLTIDQGAIEIDGKPIGLASKSVISYMPEKTYFDPSWKIKDTLDYFEAFYSDFDRSKAEKLLERFHLSLRDEIKSMSKGMQEKLQLALVMARRAKLYILDEPLGGVDPASREEILDMILTNFDEEASILISTHMIHEIERILDRVLFIQNGQIVKDHKADAIREEEGCSVEDYFKKVIV